jgi:UDPglucose--hexose-1-phosphate uridylyltransferase
MPDDEFVVRNQLMQLLRLSNWVPPMRCGIANSIDEILKEITDYACDQGIIGNTPVSRDLFDTKVMEVITPFPREVNYMFHQKYAISPIAATNWYYQFSKDVNYVRAGRIAKDIKWTYESEYGTLDITINCSKPEKDPLDIAAAGAAPAVSYPKCQLCPENAGFAGDRTHPARNNLRPISLKVHDEKWQFQYSPYGYYQEHCIVFNEQHVPMKIDAAVFEKLFDVLDLLPHYFVGSNADLPIVGGSILSHEHFQGGHCTFAMEKAPVEKHFLLSQFPSVQAGIVKWPMSVIRLRSKNRPSLAAACDFVLEHWRSYSDPEVSVFAETDGTPHNTITPIARMRGDAYECDLVLRNNLTTPERPLGLFHPGPTLHHIKKENIGLIEVMGLAVLPSRLAHELEAVRLMLLTGSDLTINSDTAHHAEWAYDMVARHPEFCTENAKEIIRAEVGAVFEQVLLDAGVFKRNADGQQAFLRFISKMSQGGSE